METGEFTYSLKVLSLKLAITASQKFKLRHYPKSVAKMLELTTKQQNILQNLLKNGRSKSSDIYLQLIACGEGVSLGTVKRWVTVLERRVLLIASGAGRATAYEISDYGRMILPIDTRAYSSIEPDNRYGLGGYSFTLLNSAPPAIFSDQEIISLESATAAYNRPSCNHSRQRA
jgi:hypothetical protein